MFSLLLWVCFECDIILWGTPTLLYFETRETLTIKRELHLKLLSFKNVLTCTFVCLLVIDKQKYCIKCLLCVERAIVH